MFVSEIEKRLDGLEEKLIALGQKRLKCDVFEANSAQFQAHLLEQIAKVPDGYFVAGGGCQIYDADRYYGFVATSISTDDKTGWYCRSEPTPNFAFGRKLRARAIGCKFE